MQNEHAELTATKNGLIFEFSYDAGLIASFKAKVPYSGRKPNKDGKRFYWLVDFEYADTCIELIKQFFGFEIVVNGDMSEANKTVVEAIRLMYLGSAKNKGTDTRIASGHDGTEWKYIFPESVLREYFNLPIDPTETVTHYAALGIKRDATDREIKKAYRRAAKTWHPDHNGAPDAAHQFGVIKRAYDTLSNVKKKSRYDASLGLYIEKTGGLPQDSWKSPLNCGIVVCEGVRSLGRFKVSKILAWEDIIKDGKRMVVYWGFDSDAGKPDESYTVNWI